LPTNTEDNSTFKVTSSELLAIFVEERFTTPIILIFIETSDPTSLSPILTDNFSVTISIFLTLIVPV